MAEFDVSTGSDTWVDATLPSTNYAGSRFPALKSTSARTLVFVPLAMSRIGGLTIVSATLSAPAQAGWGAQTITVQALSTAWDVATVTWNDQPVPLGATATVTTGALAAGERFEVDVTALVQAIADGQANYGWRVTTSQGTKATLRGFSSGQDSWNLHLEVSDIPAAPVQLSPAGVIATGAPVVTVDETDDMAAINVQVDADASGSPDFDSGWVPTTTPQLDLSTTAMTPIANNATTNYRARVKTTAGGISDWSDWVEITRVDLPTVVVDSYDLSPTPRIQAHLSPAGDADTRWQVIVTDAADPSDWLYDSGDALMGAALDHTIPLTWNGRATMPSDGSYTVQIRAIDRFDRVASVGYPGVARNTITVSLATVGTVAAPSSLTATAATSGYPDVTLTWTRATAAPDQFVILRDGLYLDVIDPADYLTGTLTWTYVDQTADPSIQHTYAVRAKSAVSGVQKMSADSPTALVTPVLDGLWLRSSFGDVELRGVDVSNLKQTDKRQTFVMPYRMENVDIVTAIGGYEGTVTGNLFSGLGQDVDAARVILEQLRQHPGTQIRLAWGTQNRLVYLRGLSVKPHPQITSGNNGHVVEFDFFETPESTT